MQVLMTSKLANSIKISVKVGIEGDSPNVHLPTTMLKDTVFGHDKKALAHFMKIEPGKPWGGDFTLEVTNSRQK